MYVSYTIMYGIVSTAFKTAQMRKYGFQFTDTNQIIFENKLLIWQDFADKFTDPIYMAALPGLNRFRKDVVDTLLNACIYMIDSRCTFGSSGTSTYISDYDVSIVGPEKEQVALEFMFTFVSFFNTTSNVMFDTNVYANSFLEYAETKCESGFICVPHSHKMLIIPDIDKCDLSYIRHQRAFAFAKLLGHISGNEWWLSSLVRKGISLLEFDIQAGHDIITNMPKTTFLIGDFANALIKQRTQRLQLADIEQVQHPKRYQHTVFAYIKSVTVANYYASEAYYCAGSLYHTVGKLQLGLDGIYISQDELIDSLLENTGDMLKALVHGKEDTCDDVIIDLSKYLSRITDAITRLGGKGSDDITVQANLIRSKYRHKANINNTAADNALQELYTMLNTHGCNRVLFTRRVLFMVSNVLVNYYEEK
jgi:hypothetical protein